MRVLYLHHQDLRLHDNSALYRNSDKEIIPVFINSPRRKAYLGSTKRKFQMQSLSKLNEKYKEFGGSLIYREGQVVTEVQSLIEETDPDKVIMNNHLDPVFDDISEKLLNKEIPVEFYQDRTAKNLTELSPEFPSFSQFYEEWKKLELPKQRNPENLQIKDTSVESDQLPETITETNFEPGESEALRQWTEFKQNYIQNYKEQRDNVANPKGVSRMSPYINSGMIGPRKLLNETQRILETANGSEASNISKYKYELGWREFFHHLKLNNPNVVWKNYKDLEKDIEWKNDHNEFYRWKTGQTGFPFVDAGIREMLKTGYMHNRTRQNVASFLTKHLLIDWRLGERFFRKHLVDYDSANNSGGWQWVASTGTDTVINRIFNPVKQGRKYDPDAEYIKKYVPELRDLSPSEIHEWVDFSEEKRNKLEAEYPSPMVNMNNRYHQAKRVFSDALK